MNGYNEELGGGGIWTKAVVVVVNSIQNLYIEFVRNEKKRNKIREEKNPRINKF